MALVHQVDPATRLVTVRAASDVPDGSPVETARESVERLLADPALTPDYRLLIVVHQGATAPSPDELIQMGDYLTLLRRRFPGRIALVTSATGHATPASLLAVLASAGPTEVRAFVSEDQARAWVLAR